MQMFLRATLVLLLFAAGSLSARAQSAAYDRPTVNFLLLKHGDVFDASVDKAFARVNKENKFYYNDLDVKDLKMPQLKRADISGNTWQPVLAELTLQNVAKKEISTWYTRRPDGLMSMSLIHSRGEFNATDDAYNLATTTKRGTDELKDFGSKLIAKTYVVVVDYAAISYSPNSSTDMHSWSCTARAFVYKLRYNDDIESKIYDTWIDEGDSAQVVTDKQKRFDQLAFDMDYVTTVSTKVSVTALMTGRSVSGEDGLSSVMRMAMSVMSKDYLLSDMYLKGYNGIMDALEKKVPAFKVQAGVSNVHPIRAKIGKKEGLRTDQRYFVTEYEMADNGNIKSKRKAVVRVSGDVVDNLKVTTGKSGESKFYQIAGGRVEEGMTLEQRNDAGLSILLGYGPGLQSKDGQPSQSGGKLRVELLVNKLINFGIPSLYLYAEGEMEFTDYALGSAFLSPEGKNSYTFSRAGFGLGKGFYFWRYFSLSPYLGMGFEYTGVDDIPLETIYAKLGLNAAINIYYPLQLVGGLSGFGYFAPHVRNSYSGTYDYSFSNYNSVFQGRDSFGFAGFLGVRINF